MKRNIPLFFLFFLNLLAFNLYAQTPPPNDDIANATDVVYETSSSAIDVNDQSWCCLESVNMKDATVDGTGISSPNIWYKHIGSSVDDIVGFSVRSSNVDNDVEFKVYKEEIDGSLTNVSLFDEGFLYSGNPNSPFYSANFVSEANRVYYISAQMDMVYTGTVYLYSRAHIFPKPLNDNIVDAEILNIPELSSNSSNYKRYVTTDFATLDEAVVTSPYATGPNIWFSYINTGPREQVTLKIFNPELTYKVYEGTPGTLSYIEPYIEISATSSNSDATISFIASNNQTYYIAVQALDVNLYGAESFSFSKKTLLPYDVCDTAETITLGASPIIEDFSQNLTHNENYTWNCGNTNSLNDFWYSFEAPSNGNIILSTINLAYIIYDDCSYTNEVSSCFINSFQSIFNGAENNEVTGLIPDATYYIRGRLAFPPARFESTNTNLINTDQYSIEIKENQSPIAEDIIATTLVNTPEDITLNAIDAEGGTLTYTIVSGPSNGVFDVNTGIYTPTTDYEGVDTFTYQANDGASNSNIATVTINIISSPNYLLVQDAEIHPDNTNNIEVRLENTDNIRGIQFDINFPTGFVFSDSDLINMNLPASFQTSINSIGSNSFRVVIFSLSSDYIAAGSQSILTFPTYIYPSVTSGEYTLPISNVVLSNMTNMDVSTPALSIGALTIYDYPLGDSNGSFNVNVLDIIQDVDYIFNLNPTPFIFRAADVNADNTINVLDIVGTQDIILNPTGRLNSQSATSSLTNNNYLSIIDKTESPDSTANIELKLVNDDIIKAVQLDIHLPSGFSMDPNAIQALNRANGFIVSASSLDSNGNYRILVFSLSNSTIPVGDEAILQLPVSVSNVENGDYSFTITDVILSDINNQDIATTPLETGVITVSEELSAEDYLLNDTIKVFPNPVKDFLEFNSKNTMDKIEVFNLLGELVYTKNLNKKRMKLDMNSFSQGVYFLQISITNSIITKKIIKE